MMFEKKREKRLGERKYARRPAGCATVQALQDSEHSAPHRTHGAYRVKSTHNGAILVELGLAVKRAPAGPGNVRSVSDVIRTHTHKHTHQLAQT